MKYFIDTEFVEGTWRSKFLGFEYGVARPSIDLISIGIVAEDDREYYAISKDFDLKKAWKNEWLRKNVLKPIELELFKIHCKANIGHKDIEGKGDYKGFEWMLFKYGKTNKQIAEEVKEFVGASDDKPEFYGYYADYDWVVFCWLFGRMIDLPNGFPMYCIDLKQELDFKARRMTWNTVNTEEQKQIDVKEWLEYIKTLPNYPKQTNEHNALADARWNKRLFEFLNKL